MTTRVYILLGGMNGPDGYVDSRGMIDLAERLRHIPDTVVKYDSWDQWKSFEVDIDDHKGDKIVLIGYSGGGSRATWLVHYVYRIDLMILYDPSPAGQMRAIDDHGTVKRAICYENERQTLPIPFIGPLGGGKLTGIPNIEVVPISEEHLAVQYDEHLHLRTIEEITKLSKGE